MPTAPHPAAAVRRGIGRLFVVKDNAGQKISYVDYEKDIGRRSTAKLSAAGCGEYRQTTELLRKPIGTATYRVCRSVIYVTFLRSMPL